MGYGIWVTGGIVRLPTKDGKRSGRDVSILISLHISRPFFFRTFNLPCTLILVYSHMTTLLPSGPFTIAWAFMSSLLTYSLVRRQARDASLLHLPRVELKNHI